VDSGDCGAGGAGGAGEGGMGGQGTQQGREERWVARRREEDPVLGNIEARVFEGGGRAEPARSGGVLGEGEEGAEGWGGRGAPRRAQVHLCGAVGREGGEDVGEVVVGWWGGGSGGGSGGVAEAVQELVDGERRRGGEGRWSGPGQIDEADERGVLGEIGEELHDEVEVRVLGVLLAGGQAPRSIGWLLVGG